MDSHLIKNLVPFIWNKNMSYMDIALATFICGAKAASEIFEINYKYKYFKRNFKRGMKKFKHQPFIKWIRKGILYNIQKEKIGIIQDIFGISYNLMESL